MWQMAQSSPDAPTVVTPKAGPPLDGYASGFSTDPTVITPTNRMPLVEGHEIVEELARGGMGVVYRAKQFSPEREVALKMLLPLDEHRADIRERFRVEVRALAEMDHPGILPLYQVGDAHGRPWFTMKLASGGTLATRLRRRKPFDPRTAAKLMATMCDAVFHAHSHGVLHRDIKPANILFDERGDAFLADFGLAKLMDATTNVTRSLAVMGTPCYIAPEVASRGAKEATTASDIYGLGAVLYELLAGRPPFIVEGMAALVKRIIEDEPERPSTIVHSVPRDLELVCLTCLAKDPRRRYATARDAADDLRRWLRGEPVAARRAGTGARLWAWARRRPALAAVSGALAATVAVAAVWLAVAYVQLSRALADARESRARADEQSEFLIGSFTDSLEKMGKLELIEVACAKAAGLDQPIDDAGHKRRARLLLRWGSVNWARGDGASATPRLREALESMEALGSRVPSDAEAFTLALKARLRLAEVLAETTSFASALDGIERAERDVSRPGILPLDDALRLQAEVDRTRALVWNRLKRGAPEASASAARAVASFRAWQGRKPDERARSLALAEALREAGKAWYNNSGEHPDAPDLEKALPLFSEGADLMRALPERLPAEEFELARCLGWMGDCLLAMDGKGPAAAEPLFNEEMAIVSSLSAQDPLNGYWQFKLANCNVSLAALFETKNLPEDAARHREARTEILGRLHERAPAVREWTLAYATSLLSDGRGVLARAAKPNPEGQVIPGEPDKARAKDLFKLSLTAATGLVKAQPASFTEQDGWYQFIGGAAKAWEKIRDWKEAEAVYLDAMAIAKAGAAEPGEARVWWQWTLAGLHRRVAEVKLKSGDNQAALASNLASLELRSSLLRTHTVRALEDPGAVAHGFQSSQDLQLHLKLFEDALATARSSVELYTECREVAGPVMEWAVPLKSVVDKCLGQGGNTAAAARGLAGRAAREFFPESKRAALPEKVRDLARSLEEIGLPDQFIQ